MKYAIDNINPQIEITDLNKSFLNNFENIGVALNIDVPNKIAFGVSI